tara:strand:+ start:5076 stop:5720 length:645 start_codon:yes stop_codon:yes gene_type:complete
MFKKYLGETIYNIFNNLFYENENNNSIIDPMTCLIRVSLLEFKPKNTKLSIKNNKITYNDPNILQGTIRWTNGDNREDIHNIYNPIIKALNWYEPDNPDVVNIVKFTIKGLEKLKSSYNDNSIIAHSIQYYITYIKQNFKTKKDKEKYVENNTIFIKLKELWNDREINIINNIILELADSNKDNKSLIEAIEIILNQKEEMVQMILKQNLTKLE